MFFVCFCVLPPHIEIPLHCLCFMCFCVFICSSDKASMCFMCFCVFLSGLRTKHPRVLCVFFYLFSIFRSLCLILACAVNVILCFAPYFHKKKNTKTHEIHLWRGLENLSCIIIKKNTKTRKTHGLWTEIYLEEKHKNT